MPRNGIIQGKAEMKRIYEMAAEWLCGIGSDKYVHLLTCFVLTFVMGHIIHWFNTPMDIAGGMAACAVFILGFFKEWYDNFTTGEFGYKDILFDAIGCILGVIVTIF